MPVVNRIRNAKENRREKKIKSDMRAEISPKRITADYAYLRGWKNN